MELTAQLLMCTSTLKFN